jgi:ribosomal protein S18 acetylase RimI-like enzyme
MAGTTIEICRAISDELSEAMDRLIPQLSRSAAIPSRDDLRDVVSSEGTTLLLARTQGRIVGMLTLVMFRIPTGLRACIEDVAVDESERGKGVGEALTREAIRIVAERGGRTIDLTSRPSREAANRLYRRLGFEPRDTNIYRLTIGEPDV